MRTLLSLKYMNSSHRWIYYYLLLGIIQALWINPSVFPPLPLRLLMNLAVFVPMFFRKECVVFGIPFFMILRGQLGTDYQYLPDIYSFNIYIPLLVLLLIFHYKTLTKKYFLVYGPLIVMIIYMFVVDLLGIAECGMYVKNLFIAFIFSLFITSKDDSKILSIAFVSVCAILSIYYLIMYNQFLETWNATEGIERSGWSDPNYFSTFLGIGILISTMYLLRYINTDFPLFRPICLISIIIVIYMAIVLTASRAGFLSATLILVFAVLKSKPKLITVFIFSILSLACVIFMYKIGVFDTLLYRLFEQGNIDTGGGRTTLWISVIENYGHQPFLNQLFGGGYWYRTELSGGSEMHNEIIAIWADYGYVGAIIFIILIISMFSRKDKTYDIRLLSVVFYLLMILTLSPFQYVNIGFFIVWIISLKYSADDAVLNNEKSFVYSSI